MGDKEKTHSISQTWKKDCWKREMITQGGVMEKKEKHLDVSLKQMEALVLMLYIRKHKPHLIITLT